MTGTRAARDTGAPQQASPPPVAWPALITPAGAVAVVLVAMSWGYGYHRDELYFLQAGRHLAVGYPDQPLLTPLLARAATELFGASLVGMRLVSAVAAGLVVLLCGLIVREFGGGRGPQALAAGCMAVSSFLLAVGHTLSTSTFDLLAWAALCWLVVRALRDGGHQVRALTRGTRSPSALPPGAEPVVGDLNHPAELRPALRGVDGVFLLPGYADMPGVLAEARRAGVAHVVLLGGKRHLAGQEAGAGRRIVPVDVPQRTRGCGRVRL